ncbi:MFS general substrate transporter [Backusella circina FSU 941]|nr:MFS general substrate transporter [Backusella circina FSU 941]
MLNRLESTDTILNDSLETIVDKKNTPKALVEELEHASEVGKFTSSHDAELLSRITDFEAESKKVTRIIDYRMMPLFCIFYFVDFLDRANIGNATLGGIHEDLHLTPKQLSTCISAFYITYIMFEVPSNIILERTSAKVWLSFIMLLWGIMTLVMAFAQNFTGLIICRLFLGITESGYIPGIIFIMSKAYQPREFGTRMAILLCMSSLSGIVSGPIAYATSFLEGRHGLHGWQYLFIIEGIPTIVLSIASYFCLFDDVSEVKWLNDEQKALHRARSTSPVEDHSKAVDFSTIKKTLSDWKTWMFSLVYCLNALTFTSYTVFAPTIIDGFGFPVLTSQLLTAPPHALSAVVVLIGGFLVDKYNRRGILMLCGFSTAALGYTLLLILKKPWELYAALFIIPLGLGLQLSSVVSWAAVNFNDLDVRVIGVAVVVMLGNSGGIVSSYLYPLTDGPHYYFGNSFNLICCAVGAASAGLTSYFLYREY